MARNDRIEGDAHLGEHRCEQLIGSDSKAREPQFWGQSAKGVNEGGAYPNSCLADAADTA